MSESDAGIVRGFLFEIIQVIEVFLDEHKVQGKPCVEVVHHLDHELQLPGSYGLAMMDHPYDLAARFWLKDLAIWRIQDDERPGYVEVKGVFPGKTLTHGHDRMYPEQVFLAEK